MVSKTNRCFTSSVIIAQIKRTKVWRENGKKPYIVGSGLHLDGVVTVAQLGQTEASDGRHVVDFGQQVAVSLSSQLDDGASEQVPLDSHLID